MAEAHVGGLPVEELLLALGGSAGIYLAALAVSLRSARRRVLRRPRR